jgi:L-ascorbate metabolism protein UlaG (beta-lactamase superfamily)
MILPLKSQDLLTSDTVETNKGPLIITFIGHASLIFEFDQKVIYVDPWSRMADFSRMPQADLILITHHHGDHLDPEAIDQIQGKGAPVLLTQTGLDNLEGISHYRVMKNGDRMQILGLSIEAIPAYNIINKRETGDPYHPKGEGNGYIISFGDLRVLVAGDTENTPEIKELSDIDIAFLPMNLPYTMTPEMVADAARGFRPDILYPYHYGNTNTDQLVQLLKSEPDIEVRIRDF